MKGVVGLVDAVFPSLFLEIYPEQIDELLRSDVLRRNNEWMLWPKRLETISAPSLAAFINLICNTTQPRFIANSGARYCSSMFSDRPIIDEKWDTLYKPSSVLLDHAVHESKYHTLRWANVKVAIEIKPQGMQDEGIEQCSLYSQSMFDDQPGRRFVPAVVIAGSKATLLVFDRSGTIASDEIDVHDDPRQFLHLILGILFVKEVHLGFDWSLWKDLSSMNGSSFIETGNVLYKVNCIYNEFGIEGRGTVCYRGVSMVDDSEVVIKDSWVDVCRKETEIGILKKLNERNEEDLCTPDGVRVIPEIVHYEVMVTWRPGPHPIERRYVDTTTAIFRHELVDWDENGKPKWAWDSADEKTRKKIVIRKLCRVVMKPFGQKLHTFTSKKVLMRAFGDIVHGMFYLSTTKILTHYSPRSLTQPLGYCMTAALFTGISVFVTFFFTSTTTNFEVS